MVNIITQNVKCFPEMKQHMVEHDVELTAMEADLICWQEINIPRYIAAIEDLDPVIWDHYIGLKMGGAPISWRRSDFEFVDGGTVLMYPGVAKISFDRRVVWVLLKHLRTGELVAVFNCHFVAGAFKEGKSFPRIRKALWKRCRSVLLKELVRFTNQGVACIVAGDFNRRNFKVLGRIIETSFGVNRTVQYAVSPDSIDQIMLINGTNLVFGEYKSAIKKDRYSDHDGRQVTVPLRKRSKK